MAKTKRGASKQRFKAQPSAEMEAARRERRERGERFDQLALARDKRQRYVVAACLVGIAALVALGAFFSPGLPSSEAGGVNLLLVLVTGVTAGGLSCLALQGGLLATAVTQRESEVNLDQLRKSYVSGAVEELRLPSHEGKPVLWFLAAKTLAYTVLGAGLGALGTLIQPSPVARGFLQIFTALFMLATALHLLRVHPIFRHVILQPPAFITRRIRKEAKSGSAFAPATLGAMTVFLPCGVTQAMMVLAINSGNPALGAAILFTFTIAMAPLFFMLGYFATKLGDIMQSRFTKFAAVAIAAIALLTLDSGLRLADSPVTFSSVKSSLFAPEEAVAAVVGRDGVQEVRIEAGGGGYSPGLVSIAAGEPARLTFVDAGGGCTLSLVFQDQIYPISGEQTIELPPQEPGEIRYSCAMGMYGGAIRVVDDKGGAA